MRGARSIKNVEFNYLLLIFFAGYFKKAVVADNLSPFVDTFFETPGKYAAADALFAVPAYAIQIYSEWLHRHRDCLVRLA
jgi:alginate O-acetyltransferase complex protein AlgI